MRTIVLFLLMTLSLKATPQITRAEYFFDDAYVKYGQGTALSVPANTGDVQITTSIPLNHPEPGVHVAYFRVKDAVKGWSSLTRKIFVIPGIADTIVGFRYCIDPLTENSLWIYSTFSDPSPGVSYAGEMNFSQVSKGIHNIQFQARTKTGIWSPIAHGIFFFQNTEPLNITTLEYYFENDFGTVSDLYSTSDFNPAPLINLDSATFTLPLYSLQENIRHKIYLRAVDESGNKGFFVCDTLILRIKPVSIQDQIYLDPDIMLFPNPVEDRLNMKYISLYTYDDLYLKIYDQTGRMVMEKVFSLNNDGYYSIETRTLPSGSYHIMISRADGTRMAHAAFIKR